MKENKMNKIPFESALRLAMANTNCTKLSQKLGRPPKFLSNILQHLSVRGSGLRKSTVTDVYEAFPTIEQMVRDGIVDAPPPRKAGHFNSPEHMARMRALAATKRAAKGTAPKKNAATVNEMLIQLSELRASLRAAFPEKAHIF